MLSFVCIFKEPWRKSCLGRAPLKDEIVHNGAILFFVLHYKKDLVLLLNYKYLESKNK